ncbi:MAG: hypothetical protein ACE5QW_09655, partial [Thermoplasmata archaeon]
HPATRLHIEKTGKSLRIIRRMAIQRGRGLISPLRERKGGLVSFIKQFFKDMRTPLYRNAIYLMMNTIIGSGLGFFFWMVVARFCIQLP